MKCIKIIINIFIIKMQKSVIIWMVINKYYDLALSTSNNNFA